jgi:hypothetical protein
MSKRKAPVPLESGWLLKFEEVSTGDYTVGIAFKPEPRVISDRILEVCRGVDYWGVKLDAATAEALGQAFEQGAQISFDRKLMDRMSYHRVPWQRFRVKV